MAKPRPLVQVATLCENVLTEANSVVTIIRVIDTVYITKPDNMPADAIGTVPLKVFVSIKSGEVTGEYDLDVIFRAPSGKKSPMPQKWHVSLLGNESGAHLTMDLQMPVKEWGVYWFDLIWEGELLTSIPIKLVEGGKPEQGADPVKQKVLLR